jgi:hypothetical protein
MRQSPSPVIEAALSRLRAAIGGLELAAARRAEQDRSKTTLEMELALMQDDRARLAVELDGALAKAHRLEATTEEMAERIDRAMGTIRGVLVHAGATHPD